MIRPSNNHELLAFYETARNWVARSRFAAEVGWQEGLELGTFSETDFLREYAWVVLNSGFRESVIRRHFDFISLCFCDWQSASEIAVRSDVCVYSALCTFKSRRKLAAIASTATVIANEGFVSFKSRLLEDFEQCALALPFIGPTTVHHLAKNLGMNTAKPDRHLTRVAKKFGYYSVSDMCSIIARETGDKVSVADLIIWRYEEQARREHPNRSKR